MDGDLALHEAKDAVEGLLSDPQLARQEAPDFSGQALPRRRDPPCRRRAVDPVHDREPIDAQPVRVVLAQQELLVLRQRAERAREGALDLLGVGAPKELELGIVERRCLRVGVDLAGGAGLSLPALDDRADRDHAQPTPERAAPRVPSDARRRPRARRDEIGGQLRQHLVDEGLARPRLLEGPAQTREEDAHGRDRRRLAPRRVIGDEQIPDLDPARLGTFTSLTHERLELGIRRGELGVGGKSGGEDAVHDLPERNKPTRAPREKRHRRRDMPTLPPTDGTGELAMSRIARCLAQITSAALIASATSGCHLAIDALKRHNEETRANRVRDRIDASCKGRDTEDLKKILGFESNHDNHQAALACYTKIKATALLTSRCEDFVGAFDWVETQEGTVTKSTRSSLIDFKVEGYPTEKERQELTRAIADKAVECRASRILFGTDRRMVGVADAAWARTLDDLDGDTLYGMLRDDLRDKSGVVKSRGDVRTSVSWLYRTQSASRCAELESVTRGQPLHPWRGALLPFFTNKKCATETRTVAGELLASSVPEYRMDACLALRDLRDKTHLAKMRRLAETDPARSIEKERQGYWTYAFVTHPVRETCQQAVNQIELRE